MTKEQERKLVKDTLFTVFGRLQSDDVQAIAKTMHELEMASSHYGLNSQVQANIDHHAQLTKVVDAMPDWRISSFAAEVNKL
tara:strand:+ start:11209 stop:11454 length:246 start_codon:yes stop_codon:yes gene_type:complete